MLNGPVFSRFPDELQEHSRAFDAELASALENAAPMLPGEQLDVRTTVADIHAQLTKATQNSSHRQLADR
ncbi:MAG: hypothetical protein PHG00_15355 [Methylococcales bacterium]|nr:hypothetical protein [Methylococcales bacterium]